MDYQPYTVRREMLTCVPATGFAGYVVLGVMNGAHLLAGIVMVWPVIWWISGKMWDEGER